MLRQNSSGGKLPNISKNAKPAQNLAAKGSIKAHSLSKKSIVGVSNISVSIRSSKKTTDSHSTKLSAATIPPDAEVSKSEIGIQVDEVELIANHCESGDAPNVLLPSAKILQQIDRDTALKRQQELQERLKERRQFEEHSAKEEVHLTHLSEFMDRGAITRNRQTGDGSSSLKPLSDRTKNALEAYDRIKRKEEELLKMFNSVG